MRCCVPNDRSNRGLTLLEVVVGIVLLASLVAGVLMATAAHQRKILFARQKIQASYFADQLMTRWSQSQSGVPLTGSGVEYDSDFIWQVNVVGSRALCGVPVHVVRLRIYQPSGVGAQSLFSMDVVVDAERGRLQ